MGYEICQEGGFSGFVPFFTCEKGVASFSALKDHLLSSSLDAQCPFLAKLGECPPYPTCDVRPDNYHRRRSCAAPAATSTARPATAYPTATPAPTTTPALATTPAPTTMPAPATTQAPTTTPAPTATDVAGGEPIGTLPPGATAAPVTTAPAATTAAPASTTSKSTTPLDCTPTAPENAQGQVCIHGSGWTLDSHKSVLVGCDCWACKNHLYARWKHKDANGSVWPQGEEGTCDLTIHDMYGLCHIPVPEGCDVEMRNVTCSAGRTAFTCPMCGDSREECDGGDCMWT